MTARIDVVQFDWEQLTAEAIRARGNAYAPYSEFPVGAAALTTSGRVIRGCNVENASYGHALCAECGVVSALHAEDAGLIVALVVVDRDDHLISPCGRCRQILLENATEDAVIKLRDGELTLLELMPHPFIKNNLNQ